MLPYVAVAVVLSERGQHFHIKRRTTKKLHFLCGLHVFAVLPSGFGRSLVKYRCA